MSAVDDLRTVKREYTEHLTVTCLCGRTDTMTPKQRNDPTHPGQWCDGRYGDRHPIALMIGPDGKAYR